MKVSEMFRVDLEKISAPQSNDRVRSGGFGVTEFQLVLLLGQVTWGPLQAVEEAPAGPA
jgi:hypothetical protein